jgi:DNA-binding transcriptional LysR family regulator
MDRLTSLTVFGRVVENGGFSAAARKLNMSVTMVSNHIQALEDRLGVRLLNRTTRKVSLTEVGQAYYERASRILAELDEADRVVDALHSTPSGTLRIHTNNHLVRFLAAIVDEFLTRYPEASVDLSTGERAVDLIEEGYDMAIRTVQPPDSSLIVRQLTPWRHIVCCAPSYLEKHPAPVVPDDLTQHNCLRYAYYAYGSDWRFEAPDGKTVSVRVSGNLVTSSGDMLRKLALAGQGIFLAPSFIAGDDIAEGTLIRLMPDFRPVEFAINAIYPHRHHLSAKVRSFIDLLALRFMEHRRCLEPDCADPLQVPLHAAQI